MYTHTKKQKIDIFICLFYIQHFAFFFSLINAL